MKAIKIQDEQKPAAGQVVLTTDPRRKNGLKISLYEIIKTI